MESADRFFSFKMWNAAITEYKRHLFTSPRTSTRDHCFERIALCYEYEGNLHGALDWTRKAVSIASSDSIRDDRRFDAASLSADMGHRDSAELEFNRLSLFSKYSSVREAAVVRAADLQLEAHRWRDARETLLSCSEIQSALGDRLDSLFTTLDHSKQKSPKMARRLSTFLPGAGQFYTANVGDGVLSLTLNAAFVLLVVNSIRDGRIGMTIVGASFGFRYYQGGRYHATRLALEYNKDALRPAINEIRQELHRIAP
ncbi:MAG: hypothetical protein V3V49_09155 [Candidatus Krumholzibacteria bacterium]